MITSTANPHIKAIRKLNDSKERSLTQTFLAEGLRVVGQAVDSQAEILEFIYSEELLISDFGQDLISAALKNGKTVTQVSQGVFESIARKDKPQGIAAVIRQNWGNLSDFDVIDSGIWVALEAVQNPGNLGTILRTADAVGTKGLILLDHSTDPYDPAAVKASMGAIFTIPVFRSDVEGLKAFLKRNPRLVAIGTSDKAEKDCFETVYPDPVLLLLGSEREGLSPEYQNLCQQMISIPMQGACDSLNLSIATGVMLYQIYQQHRKKA